MKKALIVSLLLLLSFYVISQSKEDIEIRRILSQQTIAWNGGDIINFMQPYWKSDSLMFIGKSGITYGWQNTLDNYKKSYPRCSRNGKIIF